MKTNFYFFLLAAICIISSCSTISDQLVPEATFSGSLSFTMESMTKGYPVAFAEESTKTYLDGLVEKWSKDDKIGVYAKYTNPETNATYTFNNFFYTVAETDVDQRVGTFVNNEILWDPELAESAAYVGANGSVGDVLDVPYKFFVYYPYNAAVDNSTATINSVPVALSGSQTQSTADNTDHFGQYKLAYAYVGETNIMEVTVDEDMNFSPVVESPNIQSFNFTPLVAVFKCAPLFLDQNDAVASITVSTTTQGSYLAYSAATLNLENCEMPSEDAKILNITTGLQEVSLTINNGGLHNKEFGYLFVNPVPAGTELTFTMLTQNGKTFTKQVTLTSALNAGTLYVTALTAPAATVAEPANTYIVPKNSDFLFDGTIMGHDASRTIAGVTAAEIIYDPAGLIQKVSMDTDGIITLTTGSGSGNATIAVRDNHDNILWSWQIWMPEEAVVDVAAGGHTFLSLDLGAMSADVLGAFYQWGRKDPFFEGFDVSDAQNGNSGNKGGKGGKGGKGKTGTTTNLATLSIANPLTFFSNWWSGNSSNSSNNTSWGATKTINDPCPAGYKVPTTSELHFLTNNTDVEKTATGGRSLKGTALYFTLSQSLTWGHNSTILTSTCHDHGHWWTANSKTGDASSYAYELYFENEENVIEDGNQNMLVFRSDNNSQKRYGDVVRCIAYEQ